MPKITVGILTFNRCEAVQKAIESAYDQSFSDLEIVVVDNASEDDTAEVIRERFPDVRYIRLPRNLGCPGGRNHIYANSTGEYIVNLDDDGWLGEDAIERIVETLDADPKVGILALRQVYSDEPLTAGSGPDGSARQETGLFRGGLSAFRRSMLDVIGLYPEEFFLYAEESHLAIRAMSAGYKILDTPDIIMWHPRIGGSGQHGSKWNYHRGRNEMLVVVDLYPFPLMLQHLVLRALAHGRWAVVHGTLWSYVKAVAYVTVRLPARLKNRTPCAREAVMRFLASRPRG